MVDRRDISRRHQQWLMNVLKETGLAASRLAKEAGLAMTTLTRPANDPDWDGTLSPETIEKVSLYTGMAPPGAVVAAPRGMREPNSPPFNIGPSRPAGGFEAIVATAIGDANHLAPFELRSEALELEGYHPGDVMVVDLNRAAKPHDVVCAQIYAPDGSSARTIFRIYEPPYLIAMTRNVALRKPFAVDGDHCKIMGVVTLPLRRMDGHSPTDLAGDAAA